MGLQEKLFLVQRGVIAQCPINTPLICHSAGVGDIIPRLLAVEELFPETEGKGGIDI